MNNNFPVILSALCDIPQVGTVYAIPRKDKDGSFNLVLIRQTDDGNIFSDKTFTGSISFTEEMGIDNLPTQITSVSRLSDISTPDLNTVYVDGSTMYPDYNAGYKTYMYSPELKKFVAIGGVSYWSIKPSPLVLANSENFPDNIIPDSLHTYFVSKGVQTNSDSYDEYRIVPSRNITTGEWELNWEKTSGSGGGGGTGTVTSVNSIQPDASGNVSVPIPTDLANLSDDATHRLVTDAEKSTWNNTSILSDDIPVYYNAEYATTKTSVESHSTVDSYNLLFMTDLHFSADGENYYPEQIRQPLFNTIKAAKKFVSEVPVDQVVLGGDYMQFNSGDMTKEMGISNITELNRMFDNVTSPIFLLSGNHEEHYNGGTGIGLTDDEIYQYLTKKWVGRDFIKKVSVHTLYRIDEVNGVCHLFVTTNSSAETKTALFTDFASVVSANVNNYPYIIYNHFGNTDAVGNDVESNVKDCIDYIKTTLGKSIIAWISGHKHFDWVRVYNDTLVITILNSGLWTNEQGQDGEIYSKAVGTATESAFTVLTVVPSTGKVFATRFGSGVDFECNYNGTSGSVGRIGYIPPSTDYAVSLTLSGGVTASNTSSTASGSYSNTLNVPDSHFSIGTVTVTMGDVDITSSVYNATSHAINIASVTGDIAITAMATNDYVVTLADVESVTQHDNYKPADYIITGNSGGLSTQYQSSGINAKASLKQAISSDTSFTLKADSVEPSGAGSNMGIAIRLKFWDSQGTVVKTVDYITSSNPSDLGALVQGITKNVTVSSLANATHIGFEIRTGSSATVPASIYVENLRLYEA